MSNIYCGIGEPKGKQRLGTKKECVKKNQIRLYGLNKITMTEINDIKDNKDTKDTKKIVKKSTSTNQSTNKTTNKTTNQTKQITKTKSTKSNNKKFEINSENDKKYSITEIKKMKYGIEINEHELYVLDKKKKSSKTGNLNKTDENKYKKLQKYIENANKFIEDALTYHKLKKEQK